MLEHLVVTYGYLALFVGTFLEGETILIIAGILAHGGLLDLTQCIFWAFLGSMSGDQLYFFIGRYKGDWLLARKPAWRDRIEKALRHVERHANWLLLTFRFMYGLRNVTTLAFGMSRIPIWRFAVLNVVGAVIWAVSFGVGGYLFREALARLIRNVHRYQLQVLGAVCLISLVLWLIRLRRRKRTAATAADLSTSQQERP